MKESNLFSDSEISFEIENVSKYEVRLYLECNGEEDVLSFIHSIEGHDCCMCNIKHSAYSFSEFMKGDIILDIGATYITRNSGALKDYDFILCDDGVCIEQNIGIGIKNIYKGNIGTRNSLYKIAHLTFVLESVYDDNFRYSGMVLSVKED